MDEDDDSRTHLYVTVHPECLDQYAEAILEANQCVKEERVE